MNLATNNHYIPTTYSPVGLLIEGHFVLCKVKGKGKLRFTLEQGLKTQRGSRGILPHFNLCARLLEKSHVPALRYVKKPSTSVNYDVLVKFLV
jgi:hypothetical protein